MNATVKEHISDEELKFNLTNSPLNKLKSALNILPMPGVTLRINERKLPIELVTIGIKKTKLRNAFSKGMSTNIKFSQTQLSKLIKSGAVIALLTGKLAGPIMKTEVSFIKSVVPTKRTIPPLWAASTEVEKTIHGSGVSLHDSRVTATSWTGTGVILLLTNKNSHIAMKSIRKWEHSDIVIIW